MQVRGAPLIGVTAAYGVALGIAHDASDARLAQVIDTLAATRPTAVNLHWALARMRSVLQKSALATRRDVAWEEARAISIEDRAANYAIGQHGLTLLQTKQQAGRATIVMTHCNAGRLATVAHGTALAPEYAAHAAGLLLMQGRVDLGSSVPTASRPTATLQTRSVPISRRLRRTHTMCRSMSPRRRRPLIATAPRQRRFRARRREALVHLKTGVALHQHGRLGSRISRGRWANPYGFCCRLPPIGAGCWIARTAPGIRARGCSGSRALISGRRWWCR
jgi:hypothetical protein